MRLVETPSLTLETEISRLRTMSEGVVCATDLSFVLGAQTALRWVLAGGTPASTAIAAGIEAPA